MIIRIALILLILCPLTLSSQDQFDYNIWECIYVSPPMVIAQMPKFEVHIDKKKIKCNKVFNLFNENTYSLYFDSLTEISDELAMEIYKYKGTILAFNNLSQINDRQFELIAHTNVSWLYLPSIKYLDSTRSMMLSKSKAKIIVLDGIKTITAHDISLLNGNPRFRIYLNGLEEINDQMAAALSNLNTSYLFLNNVSELSDKAVQLLTNTKIDALSLNGIKEINDNQAFYISQFHKNNRWMHILDSLIEISTDETQIGDFLRKNRLYNQAISRMGIILDGLIEITDKQAELLSYFHGGQLQMTNITHLSDNQARSFARMIMREVCFGNLEKESQDKYDKYREEFLNSTVGEYKEWLKTNNSLSPALR